VWYSKPILTPVKAVDQSQHATMAKNVVLLIVFRIIQKRSCKEIKIFSESGIPLKLEQQGLKFSSIQQNQFKFLYLLINDCLWKHNKHLFCMAKSQKDGKNNHK
jgi:hypothetical protein